MNPKFWEIFLFVKIIFLSGVFCNLGSYVVRFFIIYKRKHIQTFLRTLKEGFSKKLMLNSVLNFSLLFTSLTVFWYILHISKNLKPLTLETSYQLNPFVTIYIVFASLLLLGYSVYISVINVRKFKEITPALGFLSFWNSADQFVVSLGAKPIQEISVYFRKNIIQKELSKVLVSTIILVILEYVYKILIVVGLMYLVARN